MYVWNFFVVCFCWRIKAFTFKFIHSLENFFEYSFVWFFFSCESWNILFQLKYVCLTKVKACIITVTICLSVWKVKKKKQLKKHFDNDGTKVWRLCQCDCCCSLLSLDFKVPFIMISNLNFQNNSQLLLISFK